MRSSQTTRRGALATIVAAASGGCLGSFFSSARHPTTVSVYNPAGQPREASVVVSGEDATLVDAEVTVPPRATVKLAEQVLNQQTVGVAVQWDGTTTAYSWEVEDGLNVTLGDEVRIQTNAEIDVPRGFRRDGRVDVALSGHSGQTGTIRVTRDDDPEFEASWTFSDVKSVTYHDRVDATGTGVVTVRSNGADASEQVPLSEIVKITGNVKNTVWLSVYNVEEETYFPKGKRYVTD